MLQNVFWIASASVSGVSSTNTNSWLNMNRDAFPDLWVSALLCLDSMTGNRSTIRGMYSHTRQPVPFAYDVQI
jgi:hypothetical protein